MNYQRADGLAVGVFLSECEGRRDMVRSRRLASGSDGKESLDKEIDAPFSGVIRVVAVCKTFSGRGISNIPETTTQILTDDKADESSSAGIRIQAPRYQQDGCMLRQVGILENTE